MTYGPDGGVMEEEVNNPINVYYVDILLTQNVLHPTNKIQCDVCKKDISKHTKILTKDNDFCAACFAMIEEFPENYHIINKLDYPLF